jgi:hypothetical protein
VERDYVARRQLISRSASGLVLIESLPYTLACTAKSASGTTEGFIGRQPVTSRRLKDNKYKEKRRDIRKGKKEISLYLLLIVLVIIKGFFTFLLIFLLILKIAGF